MRTFGSHPDAVPAGMFCEVTFPVMAHLDTWTDDGRFIDSLDFDAPNLETGGTAPLMFLEMTTEAHLDAVLAGFIDEVSLDDTGLLSGKGWAEDTPVGRRMATTISNRVMRGNSVDLSSRNMEAEMDLSGKLQRRYSGVKFMGTTIVPHPAFSDAYAEIPAMPALPEGETAPAPADISALANFSAEPVTLRAAVTAEKPPARRFERPELDGPTPCVVTEDGATYGHLAAWGTAHLSMPSVTPPRSRTAYAYFASKAVLTDAGPCPTGQLVIGSDHAAEHLGWTAAVDFYANAAATWADVAVGEDAYGIWFAGQVRPGTSPETVYAARASALSGDWRTIAGNLELVAALSVNSPGFPIPRAHGFASEGAQVSLVSAGILAPRTALVASAGLDPALRPLFNALAVREAEAIVARWDAPGLSAALSDERFATSGSTGLALSGRDVAWDAAGADKRVRTWASATEQPNAKYAKAFFFVDPATKDTFGGYKLGFADVIGGELTAVWRGVTAVAAVLQGGRGGVSIPAGDVAGVKAKVGAYYAKARNQYGDKTIAVPWQ